MYKRQPLVFTLQQKYATEFQLITAAMLDRERTAHYSLKIRCQDGGGGVGGRSQRASRVTEKSLQVRVTDENDNAPVFSKQTYRGSIIENSFIGASVLRVITIIIVELYSAYVQISESVKTSINVKS